MLYRLKKLSTKRWWKDGNVWYEECLEDILGAKEPQMMTRKMKSEPLDQFERVQVKPCGKKQFKAYRGGNGLFNKKGLCKTYNPGELLIPCMGIYVTGKSWDYLNNERKGKESEEAKYVVSYWKFANGAWHEIVCIPYGIGGITMKSLETPAWSNANDGQRKDGRNKSNCVFTSKTVFGMELIHIENTRKIRSGDQILVKYGDGYWRKFGACLE